MARTNSERARRKLLVLGRVCRWCNRSDAEVRWTDGRDRCGTCNRRANRNGRCAACGFPRQSRDGVKFCARCTNDENLLGVSPFRPTVEEVAERIRNHPERRSWFRRLRRLLRWLARLRKRLLDLPAVPRRLSPPRTRGSLCIVTGCASTRTGGRGLCSLHYNRQRRGKPLT